jgi:hypothetical protein
MTELEAQAAELVAAGRPPRAKQPRSVGPKAIAKDRGQAQIMYAKGDWTDAQPRHLVALYALLHRKVYGVEAEELAGQVYARAVFAARRLLDGTFRGDFEQALDFMRWAWERERARHRWRKESGREPTRIGWSLMFGGSLLSDWRLARLHPGQELEAAQ